MIRTISNISSVASILGFLGTYFAHHENVQLAFMILFLLSAVTLKIVDLRAGPKSFKDPKKIVKYMQQWISNVGRVVIFTRDMSWTEDQEVKNVLFNKSRNEELVICMPVANNLAKELGIAGAKIVEYAKIGYIPQSRFTIIHFGRSDARIAIGKTYKEKHIIEEFAGDQHPLFYVATDLVNILIKANESKIPL